MIETIKARMIAPSFCIRTNNAMPLIRITYPQRQYLNFEKYAKKVIVDDVGGWITENERYSYL